MRRSSLWVIVTAGALVSMPQSAKAQSAMDAPAPTLAVRTDGAVPVPTFGVTTDAIGPFFGVFSARFEIALAPAHAISLLPSYVTAGGVGLDVGYHLWPLGRGLEALFFGPSVGIASASTSFGSSTVAAASIDAGWQFVWAGIAITPGAAVSYVRDVESDQGGTLAWRLTMSLGYAWL